MKTSSLLKFLAIISIFVQTTLAVDISLNGQMYRISKITYDLDYGNSSDRAILTANPWWGDASLASNAATQVKDSLGVAPYGKGPSFDYQNYSLGWNGSIIWTTLNRFWHPSSNSARDSMDGLGAQAPGHAIATALVDSDGDGVYDLDDAHPGFDDNSLEDYLTSAGYATQASYDEVVAERDARPTQASYDAIVAERDARPTQASYDATVAERDARPTQTSYDAIVAERDARPTQASYDAMVAERDARPTQASYDAIVAERDARPTQTSYDAIVAERDARPTQASYDAMVAERDARPTQASYDAIVAEGDDLVEQFNTLDSRVFALLPKEQITSNYLLTLLDSGSLGSNQDYTTVSDQGFNFNALEGQLRWYSDGVEILDNSVIRITRSDNERFDFNSIAFDRWESNDHFMTFVYGVTENEAKELAAAEYNSRPPSYFKITDDSGTEVYAYTSSSNASPDDFYAHQMSGGSTTLLDSGSLGSNQDYTTVSDQGFNFNALEGQLRWYSDGVEILDNSVIRITRSDNERFDFNSIASDRWESNDHFMTFVYAVTENEAKELAAVEYNSRPPSYFKITDDSGTEVYAYTSSSNASPDDFYAHQMSDGEWLVDYMNMGGGADDYQTINTPLADDIQYVDISSEGYKVHVDGFNVTAPFEWLVDYMNMGGGADDYSTINTPLADDIQYVDISSEGYKVHVDGFNVSYNVTEPPVATKTLEEYVTSLNSDITTARQERDARPTQAAYDAVVAERDTKLTLDEVKDLRAGSTMIAVEDGQATLSMEVEQSSDLGIWTNGGASTLQIPIDAEAGKKFFRFKMTE